MVTLVRQFRDFPHRLPMLALASAVRNALHNEALDEFASVIYDAVGEKGCEEEEEDEGQKESFRNGGDLLLCNLSPEALRRALQTGTLCVEIADLLQESVVALDAAVGCACREVQTRTADALPLSVLASYRAGLGVTGRTPSLLAALPLIELMRLHNAVDARTNVYGDSDRTAAMEALDLLQRIVDKYPYVQRYLDPPHVIALPVASAAPPQFNQVVASMPAGRVAPNQLDPSDGGVLPGLITLTGATADARWVGDLVRSHYLNPAGAGGGVAPLPVGAPINVRIVSFATSAAGAIFYH